MDVKEFDFDRFLRFKEEKERFFENFENGSYRGPVLTQRSEGKAFGIASVTKETALEEWLFNLDTNMRLHGDVGFSYLEPWAGVPVYANAFGAHLFWSGKNDVQSTPRYTDASEVENVPMPKVGDCEMMRMVLDYISYFKEQTHSLLPLSLTDTQSPCDTASLILDPCELFAASMEDPESLTDFMEKITKVIGDFSEMQMEAIGEDLLCVPGHMMVSSCKSRGLAISDDNMAVISPGSYEVLCAPWNKALSKRFGGIAVHSCGLVSHTLPLLLSIDGFRQFDCKVTDYEPNDTQKLAELFRGRDTILKVCVFPYENHERLLPLLRSDIKLILEVFTDGTVDERNRQYDHVAQFVWDHWKR